MIERLFLDRIDAEAGRAAIGCQKDFIVLPATHKAETALTLAQLAETRAKIALDAAVFELVPIATPHAVNLAGGLPCFRFVHNV
jgi:hypothetical protein